MKIVIDIDDKVYEYIKSIPLHTMLEEAVIEGTPLPKGHDDLIDRKQVYRNVLESLGVIDAIFNVPAIIEADTAESEEV